MPRRRDPLRQALSEMAMQMLETTTQVSTEDVVAAARAAHPDLFASAAEHLVDHAANNIVGGILRRLTQDDEDAQLVLPGFELPTAICIVDESGSRWMLTSKAQWRHLLIGETIRDENVRHAVAKLDTYRQALDHLRPIMEGTELTVAEAVEHLGEP